MFCVDCIMEDGLDRQNDDMNRDIKKQKTKLKKLLDKVELPFIKRPGHANLKLYQRSSYNCRLYASGYLGSLQLDSFFLLP